MSNIQELGSKLALELIPIALAGTGIPEPVTRIILEALIGTLQEEQNQTEERLKKLVGSYYQTGLDYLADARRLQGERREQWIKSALSQFVTASHVEDAMLVAQSQFYVGVCYDLLNESQLAREWYERSFNTIWQLADKGQRRSKPKEPTFDEIIASLYGTQQRSKPKEPEPLSSPFALTLIKVLSAYQPTFYWDWLIQHTPPASYIYKFRGDEYLDHQEYQKAVADYDRALQISPDTYECYIGKGRAYEHLGEYKQALTSYDQGIKGLCYFLYKLGSTNNLKTKLHDACFNKSRVLECLGRKIEAQQFKELSSQIYWSLILDPQMLEKISQQTWLELMKWP